MLRQRRSLFSCPPISPHGKESDDQTAGATDTPLGVFAGRLIPLSRSAAVPCPSLLACVFIQLVWHRGRVCRSVGPLSRQVRAPARLPAAVECPAGRPAQLHSTPTLRRKAAAADGIWGDRAAESGLPSRGVAWRGVPYSSAARLVTSGPCAPLGASDRIALVRRSGVLNVEVRPQI